MHLLHRVVGLCLLTCLLAPRAAHAGDPLKPYVVLVLDTSGSMDAPTNAGPPSCGGTNTRLNHAKCAINKIVNSYGDMVFALARFRETAGGTFATTCDADGDVNGSEADQCTTSGISCNGCDCDGSDTTCGTGCTANMRSDGRLEMLTALVDGNNELAGNLTDGSCGTCTMPAVGTAPAVNQEIWGTGSGTPLGGSMLGAHRYWQGLQATDAIRTGTGDSLSVSAGIVTLTDAAPSANFSASLVGAMITITGATNAANNGTFTITERVSNTVIRYANAAGVAEAAYGGSWTINSTLWPSGFAGFDPIRNDPTKTAFLPTGCNPSPSCTGPTCCVEQCRPYITILLTDGDETCGGNAVGAAAAMLNTDIDGRRYRIETKAIGFGISAGDADIEAIAQAGSPTGNVAGVNEGYYAANEAELQLAISSILADAIKTETCNNLDDDCDVFVDEDFPGKAAACSNGRFGKCRVNGSNVCRVDGAGLQCSAGQSSCASLTAGASCTVVNAAGTSVPGTCEAATGGLTCVPTPTTEVCNGIDDNCDGRIDENLGSCGCVPSTEICDGVNNDCDGATDEGTTVPCGSGTCQGVRQCAPFAGCDSTPGCTGPTCCLAACNAATPQAEQCNGIDDNCDGNADGFQGACSNMTCGTGTCSNVVAGIGTCVGGARAGKKCGTFGDLDPRNNPGGNPSSACEALGAQCICNPGNHTCPLNGTGTYTACVQEVEPRTEICNDLDDDCDGHVDETPTITCTSSTDCPPITPSCENPSGAANAGTCQPADCSINSCGGQLLCVAGVATCTQSAGVDNNCNGIDEDCDTMIDEHWQCTDPDGADDIAGNADDCPCTSGGMCNARESCENGAVICAGTPMGMETCDCEDDDCDTRFDEGTCGGGSSCKGCQCAFPCQGGEFPCPLGKRCVTLQGDTQGFCLADPCFGVTCDPVNGNKQVCRPKAQNLADYECVSACDPSVISCGAPNICFGPTGECRPDDCTTFPDRCNAQQNCINGQCVTNLCQGVECPDGQYCVGGQCYGSCAGVECPAGQRCRLGMCQEDPCGEQCPPGRVCHDATGECINDPCDIIQCPQGQWCNPNNNGACEDDPCVGTACPNEGEICRGGTCYDPSMFAPDAAVEQLVTTGGGGGCSTGGGSSGAGLALGLAMMLVRRRRAKGGAS
ncbi:MAG: VWA domain-containing protein [Kofleriaceae bacterium]|nr:VWA domain-containing protein [Kofleriaceae bacterium]